MYFFELDSLYFVHVFEHSPLVKDDLILPIDFHSSKRILPSAIDMISSLCSDSWDDSELVVQTDSSKDIESLFFSSILDFSVCVCVCSYFFYPSSNFFILSAKLSISTMQIFNLIDKKLWSFNNFSIIMIYCLKIKNILHYCLFDISLNFDIIARGIWFFVKSVFLHDISNINILLLLVHEKWRKSSNPFLVCY